MSLLERIEAPAGDEEIEAGKRLIRAGSARGSSLGERLACRLHRLAWKTPFHSLRLRGRFPLKLLAVPKDPIAGDKAAGLEIMRGTIAHGGKSVGVAKIDFNDPALPPHLSDHIQSFAWLRDVAAAATRERAAQLCEHLVREWLSQCGGRVAENGWRSDLWARRIFFWAAYAPYILSSRDLVYRSAVLNAMARGSRHLDRGAGKAPPGVARVTAWAGVITSSLVIQGGPARLKKGEAGLIRSLGDALHDDGGLVSRSPTEQLALVEILAQLRSAYAAARKQMPEPVADALSRSARALLGVSLGDGALGSWQGGNPSSRFRVAAAIEGAAQPARPLQQARGWGYQRLEAKKTVLVLDAAPPPPARALKGGSASTLAFEMSDGANRLVVNCGGVGEADDALPAEVVQALRTTAAHSTLTIADRNSTAVLDDGTLGKGVAEVEISRSSQGGINRVEASHDGYARRFGLIHRRHLELGGDGLELSGEDLLEVRGRRRRSADLGFAVRFHLGPLVEVTSTADGQGALLRIRGGGAWRFRCRGGVFSIEKSLWVDGAAHPHRTQQLVISGAVPVDGAAIAWSFKRAG
ncbi:MAG TPA: heparinase II/III family protein [Allosphingosinicella sp.]|nr:heparinase II/III family protein [Allosphingosinicella sp.]